MKENVIVNKLKRTQKNLLLLIIILIHIAVCLTFGHMKRTFFCDETYSYGLANSESYSFLDPTSSKVYGENTNGWVDVNYFKNYVTVNSNNRFSLSAPIRNQINDVHPPLYYILLHIVCSIFPDSFTKWTGIGLNLIIAIIVDVLLYYNAQIVFEKNHFNRTMVVFLWALSAAGISNVLFIRMYLLQTAEILGYIAIHIFLLKQKKIFSLKGMILLSVIVITGGLTHYYFYPFAFFFSAPLCLFLFCKKKWKLLLKYIIALISGFIVNLLLFPATINHVFNGYRGNEAIENLQTGRDRVFKQFYLQWINNSIFGGLGKILFLILIVGVIYKIISLWISVYIKSTGLLSYQLCIEKKATRTKYELVIDENVFLCILTSIGTLGFAYIAIVGSQLTSNRYIYPIYPMLAMLIIAVLSIIKIKKIIVCVLILVICVLSHEKYGIDYQYSDYDETDETAQRIKGTDCLLYYGEDWLDIYTAFPLKFIFDETYFFDPNDISNLNDILNTRKSFDPIVVCLPDNMSDSDIELTLNDILNNTIYTEYEYIYHYYTQAYLLK